MGSTEPISFEEPDEATRSAVPLPFPVVGIGGSAGGLGALRLFFEHTPATTGNGLCRRAAPLSEARQ